MIIKDILNTLINFHNILMNFFNKIFLFNSK